MPMLFNTILNQYGINPADVILLRHQDSRSQRGRTPYGLWNDAPTDFILYQSLQDIKNRNKFQNAKHWASFVVTPAYETLFVCLYTVEYKEIISHCETLPNTGERIEAGSCDLYTLEIDGRMEDLYGKIVIDWGSGTRAWIQRAYRQNKPVVELRPKIAEPEFPGCLNFIEPLSKIPGLPKGWRQVLHNSKGVYLLTCPKTKEQYVGSASGEGGFLQRWTDYVLNGHGGNVGLKNRNPSDYQVSILEVAGTTQDVLQMEERWKRKLQSKEMGLNKN